MVKVDELDMNIVDIKDKILGKGGTSKYSFSSFSFPTFRDYRGFFGLQPGFYHLICFFVGTNFQEYMLRCEI